MEIVGGLNSSWLLLTGATGFVGQRLLKELLNRGHRVLTIVRAATPAEARERLAAAVKPWGLDLESRYESGQLAVLRGDLHESCLGLARTVVHRLRGTVESVVHAAGDTTFRARPDGEPMRTNVEGTREAFRLARACECADWHLISTAFVCGRSKSARERLPRSPPDFRNDYEHSKWRSEAESAKAAAERGASLTIYRPSVIVGDSRTGMATRFVGIYYLFRATALIARAAQQRPEADRHRIPLRIPADADDRPNLVFVDDVARDLVDLLARRDARGGVYHLTHPAPLSNQQIKCALEQYYDIAGGRFVGAGAVLPNAGRTSFETIFSGLTDGVSDYLFASPDFDRSQADRFCARPPTPWTRPRLHRLIRYAESAGWHRRPRDHDPHAELDGFAAFFEGFLPSNIARSKISRMERLDVTVRFQIDRGIDGDWWCRFRRGKLVEVRRSFGKTAEVTFRTTPIHFWRAVGGAVRGAELFLSGDANIEGDMERGLKFAMILEEFVREFPCDREGLLRGAVRTG